MWMMWVKRILGFAITSVAVPIVTQRYGPEAGAAVGGAGGFVLHQVERFGKK